MIFNWLFKRRHGEPPTLRAIYITTAAGGVMQSIEHTLAIAKTGLDGDRYSSASGFWKLTDACQVTLISEDDINMAKQGQADELKYKLDQGSHRRNLVVTGINTKELQGKTFRIGDAEFRYYKPRPPCGYLEKIEGKGLSRALGKHSGICLTVVSGGTISVGDRLIVIA
jgi:uncharacterized protein YcbX